ncbi:MAG TPA: hypothetical protein VFF73_04975 [Planctomycetota bacterium]|nr:hypothetical protein [Planctomycetota bacterium]
MSIATLRALARALIINPDEGGPPLDPGSDEVLAAAFEIVKTLPRDEYLGCEVLFRGIRWLPLLLGPRRGRLDKLSRADARATLERLRVSRSRLLRYLFFCVKSLFAMAYFTRPAVWPAIGYDGPYLGRVAVTRLSPPPLASGPV